MSRSDGVLPDATSLLPADAGLRPDGEVAVPRSEGERPDAAIMLPAGAGKRPVAKKSQKSEPLAKPRKSWIILNVFDPF